MSDSNWTRTAAEMICREIGLDANRHASEIADIIWRASRRTIDTHRLDWLDKVVCGHWGEDGPDVKDILDGVDYDNDLRDAIDSVATMRHEAFWLEDDIAEYVPGAEVAELRRDRARIEFYDRAAQQVRTRIAANGESYSFRDAVDIEAAGVNGCTWLEGDDGR